MKLPIAPDRKIADLKDEYSNAYEFIQAFFQLYVTRCGMAQNLGLEAAMEGLEGLVNKGWARIVIDDKNDLMTIAAWRPDLGEWWMNGKVVEFDE